MPLNQFELAEAYTELTVHDSQFHTAMRKVEGSLTKLKGHLQSASRAARRMLLVAGGTLATFVKFAADAEESMSKFDAVFGDNADSTRRWAKELADSVGRSRFVIEDTMSSFQGFFVGLGFGSQQAVEMSKKMQQLAIDFGSFHNIADAEAAQRFISALSGSSSTARRKLAMATSSLPWPCRALPRLFKASA